MRALAELLSWNLSKKFTRISVSEPALLPEAVFLGEELAGWECAHTSTPPEQMLKLSRWAWAITPNCKAEELKSIYFCQICSRVANFCRLRKPGNIYCHQYIPQPDVAHVLLKVVHHSIEVKEELLVWVHKSLKCVEEHAKLQGPEAICVWWEKAQLRDPAGSFQRAWEGPEQCWLRATHKAPCACAHNFEEQLYSVCTTANSHVSIFKAARHPEGQLMWKADMKS